MKKIALLWLFWFAVRAVNASCNNNTEQQACQAGGAVCSSAAEFALPPSIDLLLAQTTLRYGNYCGALNQCEPVTNNNNITADNTAVCLAETQGCPPEPCDAVDAACAVHDSCLRSAAGANHSTSTTTTTQVILVPISSQQERCQCDATFVAAMAEQAGTPATNLCDANFYNPADAGQPSFIELFQSEAQFMALLFCCTVVNDVCQADAQANGYGDLWATVQSFCNEALGSYEVALGVNLCGTSTTTTQEGCSSTGVCPVCNLCPDGMEVTLPDAELPTGQTCALADASGKGGFISEDQCGQIRVGQDIISTICGCTMPAAGSPTVSAPPTTVAAQPTTTGSSPTVAPIDVPPTVATQPATGGNNPTVAPIDVPTANGTPQVGCNGDCPVCDICPEGMEMTLPDAELQPGQTCALAEAGGQGGFISQDECAQIKASQSIISAICGCMRPIGGDPTLSPVGFEKPVAPSISAGCRKEHASSVVTRMFVALVVALMM